MANLSDPVQFERFVLSHSSTVFSVCLRLLKNQFAADDACQETFAAAWRNREHLRPNRSWLLKVATNKCLDELRRQSRHRSEALDEEADTEPDWLASAEPSPESVAISTETLDVLEKAVSQLPWAQRVALVLSDVEEWSYREIAQACGVPEGTVKSRIFRARSLLRQALTDAAL